MQRKQFQESNRVLVQVCWIVLYRLPLFPWTLFISVKASVHNKHLKTKFKNITEWWALQPTHLFSHYFFLLIQYTANLIAVITLARAATKSGSHHALLPPHSVAFGVTYHCLLPCVVTSISLLGLLLRKSNCPEVEVTCSSEWGSFPVFIIINGVSFIDFCKRWIKARPFL